MELKDFDLEPIVPITPDANGEIQIGTANGYPLMRNIRECRFFVVYPDHREELPSDLFMIIDDEEEPDEA